MVPFLSMEIKKEETLTPGSQKALENSDVKKEYDRLAPVYENSKT